MKTIIKMAMLMALVAPVSGQTFTELNLGQYVPRNLNDDGSLVVTLGTREVISYFFNGSTYVRLNVPSASSVTAKGVNNNGASAGETVIGGGGNPNQIFYCNAAGECYSVDSFFLRNVRIYNINNSGQIVGSYGIETPPRGFVYRPGGEFRELCNNCAVYSMNNLGDYTLKILMTIS